MKFESYWKFVVANGAKRIANEMVWLISIYGVLNISEISLGSFFHLKWWSNRWVYVSWYWWYNFELIWHILGLILANKKLCSLIRPKKDSKNGIMNWTDEHFFTSFFREWLKRFLSNKIEIIQSSELTRHRNFYCKYSIEKIFDLVSPNEAIIFFCENTVSFNQQ